MMCVLFKQYTGLEPMTLVADDLVYQRLADNEAQTAQWSLHVLQQADAVLRNALFAAMDGIHIGAVVEQGYQDRASENTTKRSSNVLAQEDVRWRLVFTGTVTGTSEYSITVGCADLSLKKDGEEVMDNTTAEYAALETAFNAIARLPDNSEPAKLLRVEYVKM